MVEVVEWWRLWDYVLWIVDGGDGVHVTEKTDAGSTVLFLMNCTAPSGPRLG
jgi:hypothetical protein